MRDRERDMRGTFAGEGWNGARRKEGRGNESECSQYSTCEVWIEGGRESIRTDRSSGLGQQTTDSRSFSSAMVRVSRHAHFDDTLWPNAEEKKRSTGKAKAKGKERRGPRNEAVMIATEAQGQRSRGGGKGLKHETCKLAYP